MTTKEIRLTVFKEECDKLQTYVDSKWENFDLKNYHFLSANLNKFLPNISEETHKKAYHEILSYRTLQGIDTQFYKLFNTITDFDFFESSISHLPAIFVSFHIGSYRASLALLIKKNINAVLVMDPQAYHLQKNDVFEQYNTIKTFFNSTSDLIVIPADQKDLALQMLKQTKKGYSILAYIDGNNGFNGSFNQQNSLKIDFCGQKILVRQGLAMLSYLTKSPIIPMISYYEDFNQRWKFHDPIYPTKQESAEEYVSKSIQAIYKILESYVVKYPFQWDGWLYMHKFLANSVNSNPIDYTFNANDTFEINKKIGLFSFENKYYVLNKDNYKIFELSETVFSALNSKGKTAINKDLIPEVDVQSLIKANIILKSA